MDLPVAKCLLVSQVLVADGMMTENERAFLDALMTRLGLSDLTAVCRLRTGARRHVELIWHSIPNSELFDGTISARPAD